MHFNSHVKVKKNRNNCFQNWNNFNEVTTIYPILISQFDLFFHNTMLIRFPLIQNGNPNKLLNELVEL